MQIPSRLLSLLLASAAITGLAVTDSFGSMFTNGPPAEHASQAPDYTNCTACHASYETNAGNGGMSITGVPAEYTPGNTYTVTVTLGDPGQEKWGFELVALDSSGVDAGSWGNLDSGTQLQFVTNQTYWSHDNGGTYTGTMNGPVSWMADWTAPSAGAGTAYFYAAGNAGNDAGGTSGDYIYTAAVASAESGASHPDASSIPQPHKVSLQAGVDRLKVQMRVTNHKTVSDTFAVASKIKLPNGSFFSFHGSQLLTIDFLTLAPGETGTVYFNFPVKSNAPSGTYEFQQLVGYAPSTLVDTGKFNFSVN